MNRKPILLWHVIVLIILSLVVIVSASFPRICVTPESLVDFYCNVWSSVDVVGETKEMSGLGDMMEKFEEVDVEKKLKKEMKNNLTFSGWNLMFLTKDVMDEKFGQAFKQGYVDYKKMANPLGYMRDRYMLVYLGCMILIIMSILWFIYKWNCVWLVVVSLIVGLGGTAVTVLGTLRYGYQVLESLSVGTLAGIPETMKEPIRLFSIEINNTFGSRGCMVVCMIMTIFAFYMLYDYLVLAKKRAVCKK